MNFICSNKFYILIQIYLVAYLLHKCLLILLSVNVI